LFTANKPDDIPHLGLQNLMISNVFFIFMVHLSHRKRPCSTNFCPLSVRVLGIQIKNQISRVITKLILSSY